MHSHIGTVIKVVSLIITIAVIIASISVGISITSSNDALNDYGDSGYSDDLFSSMYDNVYGQVLNPVLNTASAIFLYVIPIIAALFELGFWAFGELINCHERINTELEDIASAIREKKPNPKETDIPLNEQGLKDLLNE